MHVYQITALAQLQQEQAHWDRISDRDPRAHLFATWRWIRALWEHTQYHFTVLAVRPSCSSPAVAYLPLTSMHSRLRPAQLTTWHIGGLPLDHRAGIACLPGMEDAALDALAAYIADVLPWTELHIQGFADARFDRLLMGIAGDTCSIRHMQYSAPTIDLPHTWDQYLSQRLGAKARYHLRRALRDLEAVDNVHLTAGGTENDIRRDIAALLGLWRKRWRPFSGNSASGHAQLLWAAYSAESLWLRIMWYQKRAIAGLAGFVDRFQRRFYCCTTAYDPTYAHLSPGKVLFGLAIRDAIEQGLRVFDFSYGCHEYKLLRLGGRDTPLRGVRLLRRSTVSSWMRPLLRSVVSGVAGSHRLARAHWSVGMRVRVKSLTAILATLDKNGMLKGCAFRRPMASYCGRILSISRPVGRYYVESRWRMYRCKGVFLLSGAECDGSGLVDDRACDRGCALFWRREWLEPFIGVAEERPTGAFAGQCGLVDWSHFGGQCQLALGGAGGCEPALWRLARVLRLHALWDYRRAVAGLRRRFRKLATAAARRLLGRAVRETTAAPLVPCPTSARAGSSTDFQSGQWVTVRPLGEIRKTLDTDARCHGCLWMESMSRFCGQRLRVSRQLREFYSETAHRGVRSNRLWRLAGAFCDGSSSPDTSGCDRLCAHFWRTEWLSPCDDSPAVDVANVQPALNQSPSASQQADPVSLDERRGREIAPAPSYNAHERAECGSVEHGIVRLVVRRALRARMCPGLTVLMYHSVLPDGHPLLDTGLNLVMPVSLFERQLAWLSQQCAIGSVTEMLHHVNKASLRPLVALTFDDGFLDNYETVAPLLDQRHIHATFFVCTRPLLGEYVLWFDVAYQSWLVRHQIDLLGKLRQCAPYPGLAQAIDSAEHFVEWLAQRSPQVRADIIDRLRRESLLPGQVASRPQLQVRHLVELSQKGHEIGSHSVSHPILTHLPPDECRREVCESRALLSELLGKAIIGFAYPDGQHNARIKQLVAEAGYGYACSTGRGINYPGRDLFQLRRQPVFAPSVTDGLGRHSDIAFGLEIARVHDAVRSCLRSFSVLV